MHGVALAISMNFLRGGATPDVEVWQVVDDGSRAATLWQHFSTNAHVTACARVLEGRILGKGAMFSRGENTPPTPTFYQHVMRKYVPFLRDCLEHIWVTGMVAYAIVPATKTTLPYPVVIPRDQIVYLHRTRRGVLREHGVSLRGDSPSSLGASGLEPKKGVFLYVATAPHPDGQFGSVMSSILRTLTFTGALELAAVAAEEVRVRPPIVTRARTDYAFDDRDMAGGMPGMRGTMENANQSVRNRITAQQGAMQRALVMLLNSNKVDTNDGAWQSKIDPVTGLPVLNTNEQNAYVPEFVPLPNDTEAVQYSLPQARGDLVALQRSSVEAICAAMGVPPPMLTGHSGGARSIATLGQDLFSTTLDNLRGHLDNIMTDVYTHLYGETEDLETVFPAMQNPDTITSLHQAGILKYKAYRRFISEFHGIPPRDLMDDHLQGPAEASRERRKQSPTRKRFADEIPERSEPDGARPAEASRERRARVQSPTRKTSKDEMPERSDDGRKTDSNFQQKRA